MKRERLSIFAFLLASLAAAGALASPAVRNVVDTNAVFRAYADYTNNVLCVAETEKDDRLPANMPYQIVVGADPADRLMAEAAITTVATSMPAHVRAFFLDRKLMAPMTQWILRRCKAGVDNEAAYLTVAAHRPIWTAADFDLPAIAQFSSIMTSNAVPMLSELCPIYTEYRSSPIRRAQPLVEYSDPRPEETFALPCGISIVLRAHELRRKFRFMAMGWPLRDSNVQFKWVPMSTDHSYGTRISAFQNRWKEMPPSRGCCEVTLDWRGVRGRQDILVFARYGEGPWGPPSIISFFTPPNERRTYDQKGRLEKIAYVKMARVASQLWQNKPWWDEFTFDARGRAIGFSRYREGMARGEPFSMDGESIVETYPNELPKIANRVRYFTRPDDPDTLDYEVTSESVTHPNRELSPRDRGEFPVEAPIRRSGHSKYRLD